MTETALRIASPFDALKTIDEAGIERWAARDLYEPLGYRTWESFQSPIRRARVALAANGADVNHHIAKASTNARIGCGAIRYVVDYSCTIEAVELFKTAAAFRVRPAKTGWIYVLANKSNTTVKVGFAARVERRLKEFNKHRPDDPLRCVFRIEGSVTQEKAVHAASRSRALRPTGEWYQGPAGPLVKAVKAAVA